MSKTAQIPAQQFEKMEISVGNAKVIFSKSSPQSNNIESRHIPLTYDLYKKTGNGFRGENGQINVLLYKAKDGNGELLFEEVVDNSGNKSTVPVIRGSVKGVDKTGVDFGSLWLSRNLTKALVAEHQNEVGEWINFHKLHPEKGNVTIRIPASFIRIYGLRNTETSEEFSVVGSPSTGGAGVA